MAVRGISHVAQPDRSDPRTHTHTASGGGDCGLSQFWFHVFCSVKTFISFCINWPCCCCSHYFYPHFINPLLSFFLLFILLLLQLRSHHTYFNIDIEIDIDTDICPFLTTAQDGQRQERAEVRVASREEESERVDVAEGLQGDQPGGECVKSMNHLLLLNH